MLYYITYRYISQISLWNIGYLHHIFGKKIQVIYLDSERNNEFIDFTLTCEAFPSVVYLYK